MNPRSLLYNVWSSNNLEFQTLLGNLAWQIKQNHSFLGLASEILIGKTCPIKKRKSPSDSERQASLASPGWLWKQAFGPTTELSRWQVSFLLLLCNKMENGKCRCFNSLHCSPIYYKRNENILTLELGRILNESQGSQSFHSMSLVYRFYKKWHFFFSIWSVLPEEDTHWFKPWVRSEKSLHAAVNIACRFSPSSNVFNIYSSSYIHQPGSFWIFPLKFYSAFLSNPTTYHAKQKVSQSLKLQMCFNILLK